MRDFSIESAWNAIRMAFMLIGGWLGTFLGNADRLLILLIAFASLDYISGVLRAIAEKNLSSAVGFRGISRKALMFMIGRSCKFGSTDTRSARAARCVPP